MYDYQHISENSSLYRKQVTAKVEEILEKSKELWPERWEKWLERHGDFMFRPKIDLRFNKGNFAGRCKTFSITPSIEVNLRYFNSDENIKEQIEDTVPHEMAHWIHNNIFEYATRTVNKKRVAQHPKEYKMILEALIGSTECQHTMADNRDATNLPPEMRPKHPKNPGDPIIRLRHIYDCNCGIDHYLTGHKHNAIQRGKSTYRCKKCKSPLTYSCSLRVLVGNYT